MANSNKKDVRAIVPLAGNEVDDEVYSEIQPGQEEGQIEHITVDRLERRAGVRIRFLCPMHHRDGDRACFNITTVVLNHHDLGELVGMLLERAQFCASNDDRVK